jgi:hypothetical protein
MLCSLGHVGAALQPMTPVMALLATARHTMATLCPEGRFLFFADSERECKYDLHAPMEIFTH